MKTFVLVAALYQLTVGVSEFFWVSSGSPILAQVAALPTVASGAELVDATLGSMDTANTIEGMIDVASGAALLLFWIYLR